MTPGRRSRAATNWKPEPASHIPGRRTGCIRAIASHFSREGSEEHMRRSLGLGLVLAVTVAAFGSFVAVAPCGAQIRINELLADPGFDWNGDGTAQSKEDEWVEIVNAGTTTVDLDSLRLSDAGTTIAFRFGFSGTLAPGHVLIVYGSDSVAWEAANAAGSAGLSLNNAGDTVRLWQLAGTDTLLVDTYTYASHEVLDDRSTGRMPDGTGEWRVFDARNPYTGMTPPLGTGCNPTPGGVNGCPTAVAPASWSHVKRRFDAKPEPRR
jgi:hypothetical protein